MYSYRCLPILYLPQDHVHFLSPDVRVYHLFYHHDSSHSERRYYQSPGHLRLSVQQVARPSSLPPCLVLWIRVRVRVLDQHCLRHPGVERLKSRSSAEDSD